MARIPAPLRATILALALFAAPVAAARTAPPSEPQATTARILLVAGAPSHGYGAHEFEAGMELLAADLRRSGLPVEVELVTNRWPSRTQLARADALVLFADGGAAHPALDHLEELDSRIASGMGLMWMHYALEVPHGPASERARRWLGGYYEDGWSTNPHWRAETRLHESHPITRGVAPFAVFDEWYFNIRFADDGAPLEEILTATPDAAARAGATAWPRGPHAHIEAAAGQRETLMWATERPDGGRAVGFTGGHFHWNWANSDYRRLLLNAIVWVAGTEVPAEGVRTPPRTVDDLLTLAPATLTKRLDRWFLFDEDEARRQARDR